MDRSTALRSPQPTDEASFQALLDGFRAPLDRELDALLAGKRAAAAGAPEALELIDGVARLVTQGGKRLRPALVYHLPRLRRPADEEAVLPLALATELLHTYLLIHDDIMDHAEVRRGQPAAHVRFRDSPPARGFHGDAGDFGRSVAILLGDLAHTWAVELFAGAADRCRPERRLPCALLLGDEPRRSSAASTWSSSWRCAQRSRGGRARRSCSRVLRLKSGRYTAERPIQLGALLAGAPRRPLAGALALRRRRRRGLPAPGRPAGHVRRRRRPSASRWAPTCARASSPSSIHHALAAASPDQRRLLDAALGDPDLTADEVAARPARPRGDRRARPGRRPWSRSACAPPRQALEGLPTCAPEGRLFLAGLLDYLWERER